MGATKELFSDMRASITVPIDVYEVIKHNKAFGISFQRFDAPGLKEIYKQNPKWVEANKALIEAIKYRSEIESDIRVEKQIEQYGH